MNSLAARRRHPAALVVLLIIGLFATGGIYTLLTPTAGAGTRAMTQLATFLPHWQVWLTLPRLPQHLGRGSCNLPQNRYN